MTTLVYVIPAFGVIGLLFMLLKARWVLRQPAGNDTMRKLSGHIYSGALAYFVAFEQIPIQNKLYQLIKQA